jgi:pyruvate formate lyase activating enzyme
MAHHSIWLRVPIIPDCTDSPSELEHLAARYAAFKSIKRVSLLPYHPMGEGKLKKMGRPPKLKNISAKAPPNMDMIAGIWKRQGYDVRIGY